MIDPPSSSAHLNRGWRVPPCAAAAAAHVMAKVMAGGEDAHGLRRDPDDAPGGVLFFPREWRKAREKELEKGEGDRCGAPSERRKVCVCV